MPHKEPEYRRRIREKAAEDERAAERERYETAQDARIEKIIASVEKVVEQVNRYADEASPQNQSKRRREILEIMGLWAAAFVGVWAIIVGSRDAEGQRGVMQSQLNTMQTQANAATDSANAAKVAADAAKKSADANSGQLNEMQTASRAWVGSIGAQVEGSASDGNDITIVVQYQNMGREPARNFNFGAINEPPFSVFNSNLTSGSLNEAFGDSAQACLSLPTANGGQIVYPSTNALGGASYTERIPVDKSIIKDMTSGDTTLIIEGCFTYYTAKAVRHSAFCYTWNAKTNAPGHPNLNFCPTGNDGD